MVLSDGRYRTQFLVGWASRHDMVGGPPSRIRHAAVGDPTLILCFVASMAASGGGSLDPAQSAGCSLRRAYRWNVEYRPVCHPLHPSVLNRIAVPPRVSPTAATRPTGQH